MLLRFAFNDFSSVYLTLETICKSELFMNCFEPIVKPRIIIPSVVSLTLVNVFKHSINMILDVVGKYGSGDELLVDVWILLLSSLKRKPRLWPLS